MIHVFSLHYGDDKWSEIQIKSIQKHIKVPYKTYSVYSHMDEDSYKKWENEWDVFLVEEKGAHMRAPFFFA